MSMAVLKRPNGERHGDDYKVGQNLRKRSGGPMTMLQPANALQPVGWLERSHRLNRGRAA